MGEKNAAADIRELYKEMVPKVRKILPADRYAIFLCFVYPDAIEESGPWLERTISDGPSHVWCNVIYDRHLYHAYGAFFWTHRIMPKTGKPDWFLPFSLLDMITGPTQLKKISDLDHSERCPNTDLTKCPAFDAKTLGTAFGGSAQCQFTGAWQKEQMRLI